LQSNFIAGKIQAYLLLALKNPYIFAGILLLAMKNVNNLQTNIFLILNFCFWIFFSLEKGRHIFPGREKNFIEFSDMDIANSHAKISHLIFGIKLFG